MAEYYNPVFPILYQIICEIKTDQSNFIVFTTELSSFAIVNQSQELSISIYQIPTIQFIVVERRSVNIDSQYSHKLEMVI